MKTPLETATAAYFAEYEVWRTALKAFEVVKMKYRARLVDDKTFVAAKAIHDAASKVLDGFEGAVVAAGNATYGTNATHILRPDAPVQTVEDLLHPVPSCSARFS